jgi:hypothetical protein
MQPALDAGYAQNSSPAAAWKMTFFSCRFAALPQNGKKA